MTGSMRMRSSVALVSLGIAIAGVGTAGVAYASYMASASGHVDGAANVDTAKTIGFAVTGQSGQLYPGASGNVTVTLTNPYAQLLTLTGLTGSVSTDKVGCTNSDFTVAASPSGLPASLTASQSVAGAVLTNAVTMKTSAADACRGANITVTLSVTGRI
jgi:hypothetical protein